MNYVDGFVIPVPDGKKEAYFEMAKVAAEVFTEHGALRLVECWGDDVPHGKLTDFYRAVDAQDGDGLVFSWIVWPSKAVRDGASPKVMADPRLQPSGDMPFDMKRMIFGGFEVLLDSRGPQGEGA
jgi:uncharacterized protein YbaA (DUF1428 family)